MTMILASNKERNVCIAEKCQKYVKSKFQFGIKSFAQTVGCDPVNVRDATGLI